MKHSLAKDRWLFILFCILVFWAPIPLGSNRLWSSNLLQAGYGFIAALICIQLGRQQISLTTPLRKSLPMLGLFLAIPLWSALQLTPLPPDGNPVSKDITATLKSLQTGLWLALVFACCLQLVNSLDRLRTLALVIIASGIFEACYGVLTILGGKDFDILGIRSPYWAGGSATGTFINRNHLAGHLEMCLAIGTGLLIANLGDQQKNSNWRERARAFLRTMLGEKARQRLLLIAMVIALVMTHSRMGNTAFFASMGLCAGIGFLIFRHRSQSLVLLFGSMILIDVFIISAWFGLDKLANRIEQTAGGHEGRLDVNPDAWIWFKEHWLTGSGAGSFTSVFPSFRSPDVFGFYDHAHNDYLQLLGEYGIIGAAFFAAIALFALWTTLQAQRERRTPLLQGMAFGSMMGIISLLIHSSTDFNLHIPANAALFTILCAICFSARHLEGRGSKKVHRPMNAGKTTQPPGEETATAIQQ